MFKKRGLSEVVTTVLVILLVLGAIAIIWSFLQPVIKRGAERTAGTAECLNIRLEAVSCKLSSGQWDVTVKRNPGNGDLKSVVLVFYDAVGQSKSVDFGLVPQELASAKNSTITLSGFTPVSVDVAARAGSSSQLCDPSGIKVTCA